MSSLITVRRVTIVADANLETQILAKITDLGAKGYTCMDCRGRGEHEIFEDPFTGASRVRIETIVQPGVADQLMDYLHQDAFLNLPVTACMENVQVSVRERF